MRVIILILVGIRVGLKINGESWKKYRIWVVVVRILLMGIPVLFSVIFEWLFDKTEAILYWIDNFLPCPKKQ